MFDIKVEWIPFITAIAGVLIGSIFGYITTVMTLRRADKSENRAIFISKIEEMHELVRSIREQYFELYTENLDSIFFDEERDLENKKKLEMDRLEMLASFYFP